MQIPHFSSDYSVLLKNMQIVSFFQSLTNN